MKIAQPSEYGKALKTLRRRGDLQYWSKVKELLENDFLFLAYMLGYEDVGNPFHVGFMNWLKKFESGQAFKGLALFPRGHLKTTMMQEFCVRQIIRRKGNVRIGITSWNEGTAVAMSSAIKSICENNVLLKAAFPNIFWDFIGPSVTPWRVDAFRLRGLGDHIREATVEAFDINKPPTGKHYDIIIYDDIVDRDLAGDSVARIRLRESFDLTFPLLEPGGFQLMVGTPYHYYDLYADIQQGRVGSGWEIIVKPLTQCDGTLLWPERFVHTEEEKKVRVKELKEKGVASPKIISIEEIRGSVLPAVYYAQYEMKALPPEDVTFKSEDIVFQDPPDKGERSYIIGVDPAKTTKSYSAKTAMVVASVHPGKHIFVEEVINDKLATPEIIDTIFRLMDVYPGSLLAVETTGWNDLFRLIEEEQDLRGVVFDIEELKPKDSKQDRVKNVLEYPIKKGQVKFKRSLQNNKGFLELRRQILDFPQCAYWDAIDALVNAVSQIKHPGELKTYEAKPYNRIAEKLEQFENRLGGKRIWN